MEPEPAWNALWRRLGAKGDPAPPYRDLSGRYGEPSRRYHNLAHIADCLAEFEPVRAEAPDPDALEWAIWYHDAVYDPLAKDNEEKSAALAMTAAREAGLPEPFGAAAGRLILATRHDKIPDAPGGRLIADVDLSILGRPDPEFDEYERRIRAEYARAPDPAYAAGRIAVLKRFLDRPAIYSTPFFREKLEAAARRNLARSISRLAGGGPPAG